MTNERMPLTDSFVYRRRLWNVNGGSVFLAARAGAAGTHGAAGCPAQCPAIKWHLHHDEVCYIQAFSGIFGKNAPLEL